MTGPWGSPGTAAPVWARGRGLALLPRDPEVPLPEGVAQALKDGIERGYEGAPVQLPREALVYSIVAGGAEVGVLAVRMRWPAPRDATIVAVAIDPARRGRSLGMRALVLAERALTSEGVARTYAIVPRNNGHGMYFMLRCGYAPILGALPVNGSDVTWYRRVEGHPGA